MKKIMFNDRYGLTRAVLEGRKTMTRRLAYKELFEDENGYLCWTGEFKPSAYKAGDVVAVAQSYKDAGFHYYQVMDNERDLSYEESPGWKNKMFVRAEEMPYHIRITDVRLERLQDISDKDCLQEGVKQWTDWLFCVDGLEDSEGPMEFCDAQDAFAALINKVSGKGTWESNPWVFVYTFELVK